MSFEPNLLVDFFASNSRPTLGEFTKVWRREVKRLCGFLRGRPRLDWQAEFEGVFELCSRNLSRRPDYDAWLAMTRKNVSEYGDGSDDEVPSARMAGKSIQKLLMAIDLNNESMVIWGALALAGKLLGNRYKRAVLTGPELKELAERCLDIVTPGAQLNQLSMAPVGCALIEMMVLSGAEHVEYSFVKNRRLLEQDVRRLVNRVDTLTRSVDATWNPGSSLSTKALYSEQVVVPFAKTILDDLIGNVFHQMREVIFSYCKQLQGEALKRSEDLLYRAYEYSRSGWLTARSNRLSSEEISRRLRERGKRPKGRYAPNGIAQARAKEARALWQTSQAARDAGLFIQNGILNHYLLYSLPKDLSRAHWAEWATELPDKLSGSAKALGYEVPQRFRREDPPPGPGFGKRRIRAADPFELRLRHAQDKDGRWALVLAHCRDELTQSAPKDVLKYFVYDQDTSDAIADPEALRAAFTLSIEYGQLKCARRLLERNWERRFGTMQHTRDLAWEVSPDELFFFATEVDTAARACPIAIDIRTHREWRGLIKRYWGSLPSNAFSPQEVVLLHNVLLGYCSTVLSRSIIRDELARKYYDRLSDTDFLALLESRKEYMRPDRGASTVGEIAMALRRHIIPQWGEPVGVSVVVLNEMKASILVVPASGKWITDYLNLEDVLRNKADNVGSDHGLLSDAAEIIGHERIYDGRIPWRVNDPTVRLGIRVCECIAEYAPRARWACVAAEPELASLPWNLLVRRTAHPIGQRLLVSIVPSLDWLTGIGEHTWRPPAHPKFWLSDEEILTNGYEGVEKEKLQRLLNQIREDQVRTEQADLSIAVLFGHGEKGDGGWWTITAPTTPITVEEWIRLSAHYESLIAHGCLCGQVGEQFVGDLSGVPGLVLMFGAQLCCSPMTEVRPDTASVLQKHLMHDYGAPKTIAQRYAIALDEDRTVGLYNLYGLPTQVIT